MVDNPVHAGEGVLNKGEICDLGQIIQALVDAVAKDGPSSRGRQALQRRNGRASLGRPKVDEVRTEWFRADWRSEQLCPGSLYRESSAVTWAPARWPRNQMSRVRVN